MSSPLPLAARLACGLLLATAALSQADQGDDLVTPVRIGRADAPLVLSMWAQQEYSHLAAREDMAATFRAIFRDWALAHQDVRIDISTMPALELHKAKLMMAPAVYSPIPLNERRVAPSEGSAPP